MKYIRTIIIYFCIEHTHISISRVQYIIDINIKNIKIFRMAAMFLFQTLQICALEKSAFRYCFLRKSLWIIYLKDVFFLPILKDSTSTT